MAPRKKTSKAASEGVAPAEVNESVKLTLKQEQFCQAYIQNGGNASEAYRTAYNAEDMKPEVIHVKACELLKSGKVSVRIDELKDDILSRHQVTIDRVINEYSKLAFTNMGDFFRVDNDGLPQLDLSAITRNQSAAISEVTCEMIRTEKDGDDRMPVLKAKIKLADKRGALDSLSKVLGIFVDKHEVTGKDGAPIIPVIHVTTTGGA
jgi:phage terminase small subunit